MTGGWIPVIAAVTFGQGNSEFWQKFNPYRPRKRKPRLRAVLYNGTAQERVAHYEQMKTDRLAQLANRKIAERLKAERRGRRRRARSLAYGATELGKIA
jgi:hypothetical protein